VKDFLARRWFLLLLAVALVAGMLGAKSDALVSLTKFKLLRDGIVAAVLFVMALPLETGAMWQGLKRPGPPLFAVAINYILTPLVAWGSALLLAAAGMSEGMTIGLLVAAATPCTLASASVWTRRAGGNDAASVLVTVITNLACFIMTPLWLVATTGRDVKMDFASMAQQLMLVVVAPMVAAQLLRLYKPLGAWATRHKAPLGIASQCGVLLMVFIGAISMGKRMSDQSQSPALAAEIPAIIVVVLAIHLAMFAAGMAGALLLGMRREDRIAVGFAGSQKTLMVGLQLCIELKVEMLPMVAYHVGQLLVDTVIADRLRKAP
jgi:sodium/bile acid cotransporter 7